MTKSLAEFVSEFKELYERTPKKSYLFDDTFPSLFPLEYPFEITYVGIRGEQMPESLEEPIRSTIDGFVVHNWSIERLREEARTPQETTRAILNNAFFIFLVEDRIPVDYRPYVLFHEVAELMRTDHHYGIEQEFAAVAKRGSAFLRDYTTWWAQQYLAKGIPMREEMRLKLILPLLAWETLRDLLQKGEDFLDYMENYD